MLEDDRVDGRGDEEQREVGERVVEELRRGAASSRRGAARASQRNAAPSASAATE